MMSHASENYFSMDDGAYVQKRMAEALLKTMIHSGPIALEKPDDYDARVNLMWSASHTINSLVGEGCAPAWSCTRWSMSSLPSTTSPTARALLSLRLHGWSMSSLKRRRSSSRPTAAMSGALLAQTMHRSPARPSPVPAVLYGDHAYAGNAS